MSPRTARWHIGESGTTVALDERGRGELTFTVTNVGTAQDRSMLDITPLDGASAAWFVVDEPQRVVGPGASVVYPVEIAVPATVPAGTFGLQAVAYSADTDPATSSVTSKRISVSLTRPGRVPPARWWWWVLIVAAVLLVIIVIIAI